MARLLSLEDQNLSTSTIISTRTKLYKDIDLTFTVKDNGDLFKKTDAAAVKQAVKNLILTNYYEKPFKPYFGANLRALLFELADPDTEGDIERAVIATVQKYEPRAEILSVKALVSPDANSIEVTIIFKVKNSDEEVTFTTTLARLR